MSSDSNDDEGVILQSNRDYDSAQKTTSRTNTTKTKENSSTSTDTSDETEEKETTLDCSDCSYSIVKDESTRFIGDACPDCFSGYLEESE